MIYTVEYILKDCNGFAEKHNYLFTSSEYLNNIINVFEHDNSVMIYKVYENIFQKYPKDFDLSEGAYSKWA